MNLKKIDSFINNLLSNITIILIIMMFLIVILEVISRYVMRVPFFWTEELARYLMFYMVMIGSSITLREERHPALLFIIEKFPKKFKKIWKIVLDILLVIVLLAIFKESLKMAIDALIMKTPALRIAFFWVYLGLPIGAILMLYEIVMKYINRGGYE